MSNSTSPQRGEDVAWCLDGLTAGIDEHCLPHQCVCGQCYQQGIHAEESCEQPISGTKSGPED